MDPFKLMLRALFIPVCFQINRHRYTAKRRFGSNYTSDHLQEESAALSVIRCLLLNATNLEDTVGFYKVAVKRDFYN